MARLVRATTAVMTGAAVGAIEQMALQDPTDEMKVKLLLIVPLAAVVTLPVIGSQDDGPAIEAFAGAATGLHAIIGQTIARIALA